MLDCGFDTYQLPMVPRACRTPRGRRQRLMRKPISEFEVIAQMAGKFSSERKNQVAIDSFDHETEGDYIVVNNFLETMEDKVNTQPCLEKPSQLLLSKDYLALGPSTSSSPTTQEENSNSLSKIEERRNRCYTKEPDSCSSQESQNMYPLKKRKLFYQKNQHESSDTPHTVKIGIKSLKISELLVDVPESATIGSLKVAVLEAVTQILKDGLNIGLILGGKNIVDDSKTLLQVGIPRDGDDDEHNLSSLGFMLEPHKSETTTTTTKITTLTTSSPKTPLRVKRSVDNTKTVVAKSVVPVRMKPASKSEMVRRRIRRPFTVSEVEALVQAVERLGTGRWRDVKFHAFDHANHRTYVDLKDKWKTLVHTAKISAGQRRGEPVPQELLDRVLAAHAFWS